jgi:hypothetical protein
MARLYGIERRERMIMYDELERLWRKQSWYISRYYPDIPSEQLKKTMNNLSQHSHYPSEDSKWVPPE